MADTLHNGIRGRTPAWPGGRALALAAVAVLGVVSLAGWALYRNGGLPTMHPPVNLATVVEAELPSQGAVDAVDRPRSGDIVATPRRTVVPHPMRVQFEETDDLYAYVQSLETRVRERDADAIWMVSRVYDYCSGFAMAPAAYDRDTRVIQDMAMRGSAAMVASRERVARRCARFVPQDELTPRMVLLKRIEAADAGSLNTSATWSSACSVRPTRKRIRRCRRAWASPPADRRTWRTRWPARSSPNWPGSWPRAGSAWTAARTAR
jgi:hypothetical protein